MIEKPDILDEKIIVALHENYSIFVNGIEFLPLGNDSSAWAYRVDAKDKSSYFLKLKKGILNLAGLFVPRFLKDNGIKQVIAPLSTKTQKLWANMDEYAFILYPFITGNEAMKVGMTDSQWTEFGSVRSEEHTSELQSLAYLVCRLLLEKKKYLHEQLLAERCLHHGRGIDHLLLAHGFDQAHELCN